MGSLNPPGAALCWLMERGFGFRSQCLECTKRVLRYQKKKQLHFDLFINEYVTEQCFFQNVVEVTSVYLCVCLRHSSGVLFGSVDQQLDLSRSSAGKFALYSPLCANPLSLSEECVSVGLQTCMIPTGPVFNAELNFIPCCFSI